MLLGCGILIKSEDLSKEIETQFEDKKNIADSDAYDDMNVDVPECDCEPIIPRLEEQEVSSRMESYKVTLVTDLMTKWKTHEENNKGERNKLLWFFKFALGFQIIALNSLIFCVGFKWIAISEDFLKWFITEVFLQILGVVFVMVKYLYNDGYDKIMRAVLTLFDKDVNR